MGRTERGRAVRAAPAAETPEDEPRPRRQRTDDPPPQPPPARRTGQQQANVDAAPPAPAPAHAAVRPLSDNGTHPACPLLAIYHARAPESHAVLAAQTLSSITSPSYSSRIPRLEVFEYRFLATYTKTMRRILRFQNASWLRSIAGSIHLTILYS